MTRVKQCSVCKKEKPATLDYFHRKYTDLTPSCKVCRNKKHAEWRNDNIEQARESSRRYHRENKPWRSERSKMMKALRVYGITEDEYEKLFSGVCQICDAAVGSERVIGKRLCVDHDHNTGEVRGFLCNICNSVLGLMNDDINLLMKLVEYLSND